MPNEAIQDQPFVPLVPPLFQEEQQKEQQDPPRKQKLTLKLLNERIAELQEENVELIQRIDALEKQLDDLQAQMQGAAETEQAASGPDASTAGPDDALELSQGILVPRSQRHVAPKKKSLFQLLRFRSKKSSRAKFYL